MSVQKIIQESINGNPLEMKEALAEELRSRIAAALESKINESKDEDDDEDKLDEAVKPVTKDAVLKIMIKNGNNPISAKKKLDKEFDVAVKSYPDATASKIANYVIMGESFDLSDYTVEELEDFMMSEDFDQLDEISKKTLASYVKKAGSKAEKSWDKMKTQQRQSAKFGSLAYKNRHGAGTVGSEYDKKSQDAYDKAKQHEKDYNKRADGWELANKKLAGKAKVNPKD